MGISAGDIYPWAVCYPEIPYLFLSLPIPSYLSYLFVAQSNRT